MFDLKKWASAGVIAFIAWFIITDTQGAILAVQNIGHALAGAASSAATFVTGVFHG